MSLPSKFSASLSPSSFIVKPVSANSADIQRHIEVYIYSSWGFSRKLRRILGGVSAEKKLDYLKGATDSLGMIHSTLTHPLKD